MSDASFERVFASALRRHNMSLSELRHRLIAEGHHVALSTLSYWRSGKRRPSGRRSLDIVAAIEHDLGLPNDELIDYIDHTSEHMYLATVAPTQDPVLVIEMRETTTELGHLATVTAKQVVVSITADVDDNRQVARVVTRVLLQAVAGTVSRFPILEVSDAASPRPPRIQIVSGGHIIQTFAHPGGRVLGIDVELDHPLKSPGTMSLEWSVDYPADYPQRTSIAYGVNGRCRDIVLWGRFSADAAPDWIGEREERRSGVRNHSHAARGLSHSVHRQSFGPGRLVLTWGSGSAPSAHPPSLAKSGLGSSRLN
ncbi:helix-turn-helix domain-containing protein [Microbacterium sp. Leaf320]|uniref:helix-turn-helix domain-containing protein n=1 Tax=Microbacterium sp. Leaf320 TaxID=1736334 RepID=UPI0006F716C8|nr:helix-turn-helix transcriptional regulator [Microbacterium sp. Leaf320]KQQ62668.1 hypothetical protein ASF63_18065 [Microbacterium sp. Leaf320]